MPRTKQQTGPEEKHDNPLLPTPAKVTLYKRECPDSFTIKTDFKADHEPGQFVQITLPGIGEAPISICSYSKEFMEFHVREVGNVTNAVSKLQKGDRLFIRGPYGKGYPMEKFIGKTLIIIGGGSGVAPLKGILSYLDKHRSSYQDILLYFGFRDHNEIIFKDQMKQWKKKYQLNLSVDKNVGKSHMPCDVCFITDLLAKAKLNPENKVVFICGPPVMMKIAIDILKNKGFTEDQIYISAERLMHCAIGLCGHCMIHGKYACKDGPVFRYDEIGHFKND
ncbi:FAD/NAD(P)-binding protein [Candidatus Woesearchaeota archaeon]|nr:FAD/NAD(P)-binding protein [Candidatus Woesearchaeota archaeon]